MLVVGLTGGIGSGKTTVAKLFERYRVPIIDADVIARDVIRPNTPAFEAIVEHFSQQILNQEKHIDRPKLRQIIFKTHDERKWLETLLHPIITEEITQRLKTINAPYVIVVIPLLIEAHTYHFIDRILIVDASMENQIQRVIKRDNVSFEDVIAILELQARRETRLAKADDLIINNDSLENLEPQVERLHQTYSQMAKNS